MLIGRLEQIVGFVNFMFGQAPQLRQFFDVLDARAEVADRPGAAAVGRLVGHVEFESVGFSYGGERAALSEVSFDAPAGRDDRAGRRHRLGQVDRARRCCIACSIRREGRVTIDGRDIRDMTLRSLRANIGVVFQEPYPARTLDRGEPAHRQARRDAAEIQRALEARPGRRFRRPPTAGPRHDRRRARAQPFGRRAPAAIDRARAVEGPADSRARRGDQRARRRDRDQAAAGARGGATRAARPSSSPIGSPPSATPTSSWCSTRGRIVESGAFDALVARGGAFAALAAAQFMIESASGGRLRSNVAGPRREPRVRRALRSAALAIHKGSERVSWTATLIPSPAPKPNGARA